MFTSELGGRRATVLNSGTDGQPLMEVEPQTPAQYTDRDRPKPSIFRVTKTKFRAVAAETATESDDSSSVTQLVQSAPTAKPYRRIKFMETTSIPERSPRRDSSSNDILPRKRRRTGDAEPKNTKLKVSRPLKISGSIHEDAWRLILGFSEPTFLLKMRTVSSMFYNIMKEASVWKRSREQYFGSAMPDCPFFMTEQRYVDLLVAKGCQNSACLRRDTRKAYWVFGTRLCDDCLRQKTCTDLQSHEQSPQSMFASMFTDTQSREQYGKTIIDLIPSGRMSSGKYMSVRQSDGTTGKWREPHHAAGSYVYLKSDYAKISTEFQKIKDEEWSPEKVLAWTKQKYEEAVAHCNAADKPERWVERRNRASYPTLRHSLRSTRGDFFVDKASKLNPPISRDLLESMSAFQAALNTANAPSDRAWNILLPKLLPYREDAEMIRQYKAQVTRCSQLHSIQTWPESAKLYKKLHEHRYMHNDVREWSPEQKLVLDIGGEEFARLNGVVADEDLVLLCLRNVHDRYEQLEPKPRGLNFDGTEGVYKLSLDDARMIVEEVMEPEIDRNTLRGYKVFESFKCAGCTRHNTGRRWSVRTGFEHMLQKHATTVGEDLHFHRFAKNFVRPTMPYPSVTHPLPFLPPPSWAMSHFPWYLVEWTKTLPLLPCHTEVSTATKWDPESDEPYVELSQSGSPSAFAGRHAVSRDGIESNDFKSNFTHAAGALASTTLGPLCVVKIALKYAMDLHKPTDLNELDPDDLLDAIQHAQEVNPAMTFKAKCGACCSQPDVSKHVRYAKTPVDIRSLRQHWYDKHGTNETDWAEKFLHLPSDIELYHAMTAQDEQLSKDQEQSKERETVGIQKTVRKVPDKKAATLMGKEMAKDVFGKLFAKGNK